MVLPAGAGAASTRPWPSLLTATVAFTQVAAASSNCRAAQAHTLVFLVQSRVPVLAEGLRVRPPGGTSCRVMAAEAAPAAAEA